MVYFLLTLKLFLVCISFTNKWILLFLYKHMMFLVHSMLHTLDFPPIYISSGFVLDDDPRVVFALVVPSFLYTLGFLLAILSFTVCWQAGSPQTPRQPNF